jgi:PPOX class probable F420-dependent enzyme
VNRVHRVGLRASGAATTFTDEELTFINRNRVARLASADANGVPHLIPIVYALIGNAFYFVVDEKPKRTRTGLKRLRNIAANPQVALLIDEYDDDWRRLAYLLVHGRGRLVEDRDEYETGLSALRRRYPQYVSMPIAFGRHPMMRINVQRRHWWRAQ